MLYTFVNDAIDNNDTNVDSNFHMNENPNFDLNKLLLCF